MFSGRQGFAFAEDELDNDDSDSTGDEASVSEDGPKVEDDDTDDVKLSASPDAETTILFTKPYGSASSGINFFPLLVFHLSIGVEYWP